MKGGEFIAVYSVDELRMIVSDIAKQYGVKRWHCLDLTLPESRHLKATLIYLLTKAILKACLCLTALYLELYQFRV